MTNYSPELNEYLSELTKICIEIAKSKYSKKENTETVKINIENNIENNNILRMI